MSRDHHWRWRSFLPEPEEDRARPEDQDDARVHELGSFVEHRPPWLGPSHDAHIMEPLGASPPRSEPPSLEHREWPPRVERVVRPRTQRPDLRVREDICDAMTHDGWLDATHLEVTVERGHVTLGGEVADRAQKWRAEDHAEHTLGVVAVVNRIRVRRKRDAEREERPATGHDDGHARRGTS